MHQPNYAETYYVHPKISKTKYVHKFYKSVYVHPFEHIYMFMLTLPYFANADKTKFVL